MPLPTAYLAPISWYAHFLADPAPEIEVMESFPKQTLRNRCTIAGANGTQTLTVPVRRSETKQLTRDTRIAYREPWQHQHFMALTSAYQHTPFFPFLADDLLPIYSKQFTFLIDFNMQLHDIISKWLQTDRQLSTTEQWSEDKNLDRFFYLNTPQPQYYQIFAHKNGFCRNLSIIDLIANIGTEANAYLNKLNTRI